MDDELEALRKLFRGTFQEAELVDIYFQYRDKYRVQVSLLQQPKFPEKYALGIIPKLLPMDLLRIAKNKTANPNIRKRVELEFVGKYNKFPMGEKISYLKIAPNSLLSYFIEETDPRLLGIILSNPYAAEDLIVKFVHRRTERFSFYEALADSEWYKRPQVAEAISHDTTAPIKILVMIIPYLSLKQLERLFKDESTHQVIKHNIVRYLESR
jgi:hypothetical protein